MIECGITYDFKPFDGAKHFAYNWIQHEGMPQPTGVTNIWILGTEDNLLGLLNQWNQRKSQYKYFL